MKALGLALHQGIMVCINQIYTSQDLYLNIWKKMLSLVILQIKKACFVAVKIM